jgi:RNA recognition motif-containing protein
MRIKVTEFPGITNKEEIKRIFSEKGTVSDVQKEYGKNTAYVTMPYDYQGIKAIQSTDGTRILGRIIKVEECV